MNDTQALIDDLLVILYCRDQCPNCGGKGIEYVSVGEGDDQDVQPEVCECSNAAMELLDQHKDRLVKLLKARENI